MGRASIRLMINAQTGKKDIWIDLESDADALPIEHEQDHRAIVERLLGQGILKPDELGQVQVQRGNQSIPRVRSEATRTDEQEEPSAASQDA